MYSYNTITLQNGATEYITSPAEYQELIRRELGYDAEQAYREINMKTKEETATPCMNALSKIYDKLSELSKIVESINNSGDILDIIESLKDEISDEEEYLCDLTYTF